MRIACVATAILYVKTGCPYCRAATEYLDDHNVAYEKADVRGDERAMQKLRDLSGQSKTPTLDWNGEVLADFGTDDLEEFLRVRAKDSSPASD